MGHVQRCGCVRFSIACGRAWHGGVGQGKVRLGKARLGKAREPMAQVSYVFVMAGFGNAGFGAAWRGWVGAPMVQHLFKGFPCGKAGSGLVRLGKVRHGEVWEPVAQV